jgi:D-glycero-alpha-D-manno-heptose-7-phosphate kinase
VVLRSEDQNVEARLSWNDLMSFQAPPQLELHLKLLRHFARKQKLPKTDLSLSTRAKSPAGAGLGGSSTLSISMIGALASWVQGSPIDPIETGERWIDVVRDVETTVIKVPAGVQDYYGAMFGGLQAIHWGEGKHSREWLSQDLIPELENRLLLFYSGQSRNSGINNWVLFKSFIDRQAGVPEQFEKINSATIALEAALRARDWNAVGKAIGEEWTTRRGLASGISTSDMDRAFATALSIAPARSGKVCGAGGGGCFFLYVPDPKDRDRVEKAVVAEGMRALPFRAVPRGLEVQVDRGT